MVSCSFSSLEGSKGLCCLESQKLPPAVVNRFCLQQNFQLQLEGPPRGRPSKEFSREREKGRLAKFPSTHLLCEEGSFHPTLQRHSSWLLQLPNQHFNNKGHFEVVVSKITNSQYFWCCKIKDSLFFFFKEGLMFFQRIQPQTIANHPSFEVDAK